MLGNPGLLSNLDSSSGRSPRFELSSFSVYDDWKIRNSQTFSKKK